METRPRPREPLARNAGDRRCAMRSELKIGIVVGVVIVVGIIFLVVRNTQDDNNQMEQMSSNPQDSPSHTQKNITQNPTDSVPTKLPLEPAEKDTTVEVIFQEKTPAQPSKDVIPAVKEVTISPVVIAPEPEKKLPRYHVVKNGENLYTISELYYGQGNQTAGTKAIQKANPNRIKNINVIHPGWRLRIPYPEDITP